MKKFSRRFISSVLAVLMILCIPAFAEGTPSGKEEVVYANLSADGQVKGIYVVNVVKPDENGRITDYGDYSNVRNMTTADKISYSGDTVHINTDSDRIYYEGTLKANELPWNISIKYLIDGKETPASELAGSSGALEIRIKINENKNVDGSFYDDFALQISATLDTKKCSNIVADGATIANAGSNKVINYTVLPGSGADISITADVTDFEMAAISINGMTLALSIDIDTDDMVDQMEELESAIAQLSKGAGDLSGGSKQVAQGANELNAGMGEFKTGVADMDTGVKAMQAGMLEIQLGMEALDANSDSLAAGSQQIYEALKSIDESLSAFSADAEQISMLAQSSELIYNSLTELTNGLLALKNGLNPESYKGALKAQGIDVDAVYAANQSAAQNIQSSVQKIEEAVAAISNPELEAEIKPYLEGIKETASLFAMNNAVIAGTTGYLESLYAAADNLYNGLNTLQQSYAQINAGIQAMAAQFSSMLADLSMLAQGINKLYNEYGALNSGVAMYTDSVGQILEGYTQLVGGMNQISEGSSALTEAANTMHGGVSALAGAMDQLYEGTEEFYEGTSTLKKETSGMSGKINDTIDDMLSSVSGDVDVKSFTSAKNTFVDSVQFVIQTEPVKITEEETKEDYNEEDMGFFDKLMALFDFLKK